jgi:small subunit ribosomal protein S19e
MTDPRYVPADMLINEITNYLKENVKEIKPPEWAAFVKTSTGKERLPIQNDWWYRRSASILRKLYLIGPASVETFRTIYGTRKRYGQRMEHHVKGSGSIIREILQQLEKAGLVEKTKEGRILTKQGRSIINKLSTKIFNELIKIRPELIKYKPGGGKVGGGPRTGRAKEKKT